MTVPVENMKGKNKINEMRKQKGEKKYNKIILAAYFMNYKRVHERGRKRITKIYKIKFGKEKNEENI